MPFSWTLTWLFMFLLTFTVFLCLVLCRAWCRQSHKATRFLLFTIRCCSKHVHLCYFFRPLSVRCSWLGCIIIIINENLLLIIIFCQSNGRTFRCPPGSLRQIAVHLEQDHKWPWGRGCYLLFVFILPCLFHLGWIRGTFNSMFVRCWIEMWLMLWRLLAVLHKA